MHILFILSALSCKSSTNYGDRCDVSADHGNRCDVSGGR